MLLLLCRMLRQGLHLQRRKLFLATSQFLIITSGGPAKVRFVCEAQTSMSQLWMRRGAATQRRVSEPPSVLLVPFWMAPVLLRLQFLHSLNTTTTMQLQQHGDKLLRNMWLQKHHQEHQRVLRMRQ